MYYLHLYVFSDQAEILHSLSSLLDETRCQFPRLYFVSDEELVEVLAATTRDVRQLLPVARKCFPGIVDIVFEVPSAVEENFPGGSSGTRFALNGRLYNILDCLIVSILPSNKHEALIRVTSFYKK